MSDWIEALGDDDEQRRTAEALHDQALVHRIQVIGKKKHAFWASLMEVINRDVEKFRVTFKGRRTIDVTTVHELGVRLYKFPYPTVLMDAEIPYNATNIKVSYIKTFNINAPMERVSESFELSIDKSDNILIGHNGRIFQNLDAVSRFLLEPVFRLD